MPEKMKSVFTGQSSEYAKLEEILMARENGYLQLLGKRGKYAKPVICLTMNIPGPEKSPPAVVRAFEFALGRIREALAAGGIEILHEEKQVSPCGCRAYICADADEMHLKQICMEIENGDSIGRLLDIDVVGLGGSFISRSSLGYLDRACIICGKRGKYCASRREHGTQLLQSAAAEILYDFFLRVDAEKIRFYAADCLRLELITTPKPGLVDLNNNGSHTDMDVDTFLRSVDALAPYFEKCFLIGAETAALEPEQTFLRLREAGKAAENDMFLATDGVNTHRGAIFLLGILCGALGRIWTPAGITENWEEMLDEASAMTKDVLLGELDRLTAENAATAGEKLYVAHGIKGARGQAAEGFPVIRNLSLPCLQREIESGKSICDAGVNALLYIISGMYDTNVIHRSDLQTQKIIMSELKSLLKVIPSPGVNVAMELDKEFIDMGISPGGCADMLAATYFIYMLKSGEGSGACR